MKLSELKAHLSNVDTVNFKLPTGEFVPNHFHVTEVGLVTRHFIDCGGTERLEKVVNFQLWDANDFEHRLKPGKLLNIIALSERKLGIGDVEIEVEYQSDTIGKYDLGFNGSDFELLAKQTACLAKDQCGVPSKVIIKSDIISESNACCAPNSGCC